MRNQLTLVLASYLAVTTALVFAGENDQSNSLSDLEVLESVVIIDCGQWPIELDRQLVDQFRSN